MAAAIGVGVGGTGLAIYSAGLFAADLATEIGLGPAQYGASITLVAFGLALAAPIVGHIVDKVGVKAPAIFGALCAALGFVALATVVHSVAAYMTTMAFIGFFGARTGPIAFSRAVSSWFDRSRGLALGITMMGSGVATAIIPITIGRVVELEGWKYGYLTLACVAVAGVIPSLFFLSVAPRQEPATNLDTAPQEAELEFSAIRRDPLYWRLILTFALMAITVTGLVPYLIPMLRQDGMSIGGAAVIASTLGVAVIVSRVVVGWLIDILRPTVVTAVLCLLCAGGVLLFAVGGIAFAPALALALGCLLGAELDLVGFFTSRYFGLVAFGKAFAGPYMAFVIGGGIAPLCVGAIVERTGSYTVVLHTVSALAALCAVAFLALPPVRTPKKGPAIVDDTRKVPVSVSTDE
ncbi:MFS transporter [Rhodococcus sp. PAMC28707]|uniref:MFS transporter n=1 Tax=unclassified Rhodococcus (in: high G+C Gram-positive bacteria) TaxID=192944 RepID=UPI00109DB996|nr:MULTISPECIES: MFS transporter [unclassified Rhodococcus (in: high G+C Gram-positive bacteria)]QCB51766.1 MFS transporter [Rhodococcus sp. PAMC28705]QCB60066.1 MFS transporter [Rhodococcus sp. PAMC28707]